MTEQSLEPEELSEESLRALRDIPLDQRTKSLLDAEARLRAQLGSSLPTPNSDQ